MIIFSGEVNSFKSSFQTMFMFLKHLHPEAAAQRCSVKTVFLEISQKFVGKHLCQSLWSEAFNFIQKETLAEVFSCEFC